MKSAEIDFRNPKVMNAFAYSCILTALASILLPRMHQYAMNTLAKWLLWVMDSYEPMFWWILLLLGLGISILVYQQVAWSWPNRSEDEWNLIFIQLAGLNVIILPQYGISQEVIPFGMLYLFIGLLLMLCPKKALKRQKIDDELFRGYFAKRIGENLRSDKPNIRRIAILGPWGEGKTTLLKLIRQDLEENETRSDKRFKCAWVNPWKASNPEEAHRKIAHAINDALGESSLFPFGWQRKPYVSTLVKKMRKQTAGSLFLDAIDAHSPDNAKEFMAKIDSRIDIDKDRIVVFIDDMERSEPEVVRGMMPVIDSLANLNRMFFVFAIDPKQLGKAFTQDQTDGHLDKVMDLQLVLPNSTPVEIGEWMEKMIQSKSAECRKLNMSLSALRNFFPGNPRRCLKFLRQAEYVEKMFLVDLGDNEYDFRALFLILLGDVRFPGLQACVESHRVLFDEARAEVAFLRHGGGDKNISKLLRLVLETTHVRESSQDAQVIEKLLLSVYEWFDILTDHSNETAVDWLLGGYRKRLRLPIGHMRSILKEFELHQGMKSFENLVRDYYSDQKERPSDMQQVLAQLHEAFFESISSHLRSTGLTLYQGGHIEVAGIRNKLSVCKTYFSNETFPNDKYESSLFQNPEFLNECGKCWMSWIRNFPISKDETGELAELRQARVDAASALLCSIPYEECSRAFIHRGNRDFGRFANGDDSGTKFSHQEADEVENSWRKHIAMEFFRRLETDNHWKAVHTNYTPGMMPRQETWAWWFPVDQNGNVDNNVFDDAIKLADTPEGIIENARVIVLYFFIEPLLRAHVEGRELAKSFARSVVEGDENFCRYVRGWWDLAVREAETETSRDEVIRRRSELLDPKNLTVQEIRFRPCCVFRYFPLPEDPDLSKGCDISSHLSVPLHNIQHNSEEDET